tara:strand:+ start:3355 stop:4569 length:1215 start_codon:yes stop_codon:yes gene_type:complete
VKYLDSEKIRKEFPFIVKNKESKLIYFDNAATTHKPQAVLSSIANYYTYTNSNTHRSSHVQGVSSTEKYEQARQTIADFIGANTAEIIFTSGATDSINLVANSYVQNIINQGDGILTTEIEHHSNFLPWQKICKTKGGELKMISFDENFKIRVSEDQLIKERIKFIAIHHVSNVTACIQDVKKIIKLAKKLDIPILIDGSQAASHLKINVKDLDCDFYCFSGHKLFGPTGTGILYAKDEKIRKFLPNKLGGGMVSHASVKNSVWERAPLLLEAGTPNICGSIALADAVKYILKLGLDNIYKHEKMLAACTIDVLKRIPNITLYRCSESSIPIFSFNINGIHHYDIASLLAENKISVRSGHLCCQPLMQKLNINGCLRASLSIYNTVDEIEQFGKSLLKIVKFLT